jgi:hypothetical protein
MEQHHASVFIYPTHAEAEQAIRILDRAGFDIKQLSIIGKGYHSEEHPVRFYTTSEKIKTWGGVGAFWGGLWGLLFAPAVSCCPVSGWLPWQARSSPLWSAPWKVPWWLAGFPPWRQHSPSWA